MRGGPFAPARAVANPTAPSLALHEVGRKASPVSTRAEGSDAICVKSNIVQNHARTVGITFSSYTKSLFQTRSTLLARTKSYRLLARGRAQTCVEPAVATHAQITLCIPGGASCTAHKLCELVDRDLWLPASTQIRAQQLNSHSDRSGGKGGWFELSRASPLERRKKRLAVPGGSPREAFESCIDSAGRRTTTRQRWGERAGRGDYRTQRGGGGRHHKDARGSGGTITRHAGRAYLICNCPRNPASRA